MKTEEYKLIPMSEITNEARKLAVLWVENLQDAGGIMIQQKHKLASDIMNYAESYASETLSAKIEQIRGLKVKFSGREWRAVENIIDDVLSILEAQIKTPHLEAIRERQSQPEMCKWLHKSDGLKYNLKPGCILDFEHWEYNDFFLDEFPEYKYCPFCGKPIERLNPE